MKVAPWADRNRAQPAIILPTTGWLFGCSWTRVPEMGFRAGPWYPQHSAFSAGGGRCWLVQSLCIIGADTLVSDNSDLCRPGNFAGLISFSLGLKRGWQIVQEINFGIGSMSCWVRKRSNSHLGNEKAATPTIRALLSSVWTFFGGWALGLCEL